MLLKYLTCWGSITERARRSLCNCACDCAPVDGAPVDGIDCVPVDCDIPPVEGTESGIPPVDGEGIAIPPVEGID